MDFSSATPTEILKHIVRDGRVDREEVKALAARLEDDWHLSQDEAELLFQINHVVGSDPGNDATWPEFFREAITQFVVFDMHTPGEVDAREGDWLCEHLTRRATLDANERALLESIRQHATTIHGRLSVLMRDLG